MSSENSAKRTIISKLSFFQQKDSKKLKTSDTDSVTEPPITPDTKGKQKANDNNMEVDSATSVELSSTTSKDNSVKTSATGIDASIHAPDKLSWAEETDKMMVDNTSTSTIPPSSSLTLTEKITAAVSSRDANDTSTNQTASSQANKEPPPEEEVFIKVPKVTCFFAMLSNVVLEGDTTSKQIAQLEHILAQSNGFLGVRYSHYKKSYTLCTTTRNMIYAKLWNSSNLNFFKPPLLSAISNSIDKLRLTEPQLFVTFLFFVTQKPSSNISHNLVI